MEFRVLGTVGAEHDGRPVDLGKRLERGLLGLLLVHLGTVLSTERLVDLLWDADGPAQPRSSLQVQVSRLRARLAAVGADRHGFHLVTRPGGYLLEGDADLVDLHRFRARYERARAAGAPADRSALLRPALALWRGPLLGPEATDRVRELVRPPFDELFLGAADLLVTAELDQGRHQEILAELADLIGRHPLHERFAEAQILALYRSGRRAEALDAYTRIRDLLDAELGLEPSPALRQTHVAVLRDDPALDAPGPAEPPAQPAPSTLPPDVPDFTGRVAELAQLDALLPSGDGHSGVVLISAIDGTGGVGKTALAVHWARLVRRHFPDGQLYVNLHGYSSSPAVGPLGALTGLLLAVGVAADEIPADLEQAQGMYRTLFAHRRILLLLDNADSPEHVRPLLPASSGSLVLVTSRAKLSGLVARDGARRLHLDVLTAEESAALLTRVIGADRCAAEPGAVAELADLCGHLPLALRISAALLTEQPRRTLREHVAELRASEGLSGLEVAGDPESSVRAVFDQSYRTLGAPAARVFRLCGLAPGPDSTADAVGVLTGTGAAEAAGILGRLVAAHLVEEPTPGRYGLHDLTRNYTGERAALEDDEAARADAVRRLASWYLARADVAATLLYPQYNRLPVPAGEAAPFADRAGALAWLDAERPNLNATIEYCARRTPETAWLLADTLRGYYDLRHNAVDWLRVTDTAMAAATGAGDERAQAALHASLALLHRNGGRLDRAVEHDTLALGLSERSGWDEGAAAALSNLGVLRTGAGALDEAAGLFARAAVLNRGLGRTRQVAVNLNNLGVVHLRAGRLDRAVEYLGQARDLYREDGAGSTVAATTNSLGDVYLIQGDVDRALEQFGAALELYRQAGDHQGEARATNRLASAHRDAGRADLAERFGRAALELSGAGPYPALEAEALGVLGDAAVLRRDGAGAADLHGRALRAARDAGHRYAEADALVGLAYARHLLGEADQAVAVAREAVATAREIGSQMVEGHAELALATVLGGRDRAGHAERALELYRASGHTPGQARARTFLDSA
ncbi:BTAD domain-containing putative transcriptional regulator [Longispora sp. NPDC051575]|uniref:AfsR/SARP family transcriptional regulator n=1 Tax=Longispora sp. NPDC051575 TaxID=3154943 RepID=UPI00343A96A2